MKAQGLQILVVLLLIISLLFCGCGTSKSDAVNSGVNNQSSDSGDNHNTENDDKTANSLIADMGKEGVYLAKTYSYTLSTNGSTNETTTIYNEFGEPVKTHTIRVTDGDTYETIVTDKFDADGMLVEHTTEYISGYDFGPDNIEKLTVTSQYVAENVLERVFGDENGNEIRKTKIEYDSEGNKSQVTNYLMYENEFEITGVIVYDSFGNVVESSSFFPGTDNWTKVLYDNQYYDDKLVRADIIYITDQDPVERSNGSDGYVRNEYELDENGNIAVMNVSGCSYNSHLGVTEEGYTYYTYLNYGKELSLNDI